MSGAQRNNKNKVKISLVLEAGEAIKGLARVLEYGASQHTRGDWKKGFPNTELVDSLGRHLLDFMSNKDLDDDSGLPTVDFILANALFLSQQYHTGTGKDDRVRHDLKVFISWDDA